MFAHPSVEFLLLRPRSRNTVSSTTLSGPECTVPLSNSVWETSFEDETSRTRSDARPVGPPSPPANVNSWEDRLGPTNNIVITVTPNF